jgi:regulator of sigma E protease
MDDYSASDIDDSVITVKFLRDGKEQTTKVKTKVVIYSISMTQDINSDDVKIAELSEKSLAYKGGLRTGDIITDIKYTGDEFGYIQVETWKDVYKIFTDNIEGKEMILKVNRNGESVECTVDPYAKEVFDKTQNVGITAILMGVSPQVKFSLGKSIIYSFTEFYGSLVNMVNTLGMLFFSSEVGVGDLSGPVGIFSLTSQAASQGFGTLLNFNGFLSVKVGFMNLLPIPALDGGRLVFVAYEAITKKKPNQKVETALITITMLLLFGLIIFVSFNDILRLIGVK